MAASCDMPAQSRYLLDGNKCHIGTIVIIAVGAFVVRMCSLDAPACSRDEGYTWKLIQLSPTEIVAKTGGDVHPPLYYLIAKLWGLVFGNSIISLRYLSAALGTLAVICIYAAVYQAILLVPEALHNRRDNARFGAFVSATLAMLSSHQVAVARTARMYSFGAFLASMALYLLIIAISCRSHPRTGTKYLVLYSIAMGAFLYAHYFAIFSCIAYMAFVAWEGASSSSLARKCSSVQRLIFLPMALIILLYCPWIPYFISQGQAVQQSYWIPQMRVMDTVYYIASWATSLQSLTDVTLLVGIVGIFVIVALIIENATFPIRLFVCHAVVPWVCCIVIALAFGTSLLQLRYFTFAQVSVLCLYGVVSAQICRKWAIGALILSVLIVTIGLMQLRILERESSLGVTSAMDFLAGHAEPGDLVVVKDPADLGSIQVEAMRRRLAGIDIRTPHLSPSAEQRRGLCPLDKNDWISGSEISSANRIWVISDIMPGPDSVPDHVRYLWRNATGRAPHAQYLVVLFTPGSDFHDKLK